MAEMAELPDFPRPPGEPVTGKTYIADGWVYRDMSGRMSYEMWDLFTGLLGEGNYVILIMSQGHDWKRGQFLISPDGMQNLSDYLAAKKSEPTP